MAEHDKPDELDKADEQKQQEWQARFAQKRLDLSQSVEEALADPSLQEDEWADDEDELDSLEDDSVFAFEIGEEINVKDISLIPPRLTLQSKPMPVVRPDTPSQPAEFSAQPNAGDFPPGESTGHTDPFSADEKIKSLPQALLEISTELSHDKPRLAGRTTKVLLKAIAPPVDKTEKSPSEETTGTVTGAVEQVENEPSNELRQAGGTTLFGSGMFKRGQGAVMIENPHITRSSVVVVMLTGYPGPVVVQYVSLYPQTGFTVHLSASAEREAGFNYVILVQE
jgi:hypothetical protein